MHVLCGQTTDAVMVYHPAVEIGCGKTPEERRELARTESADDRRTRRQGKKQSSDTPDKCDEPADQQTIHHSLRQIDSADSRDDQITEDQQNTCYPDEARYNQAKNSVEEKIPPTYPESFLVSRVAIERDEEKFPAENEM
jgi:hypothetical protein